MRRLQRSAWALAAVLVAGCAAHEPPRPADAGEPASVAGRGLWMASDQAEQRAAISGRRLDATELGRYIDRVNCRVTGEHCPDIRVYTMQVPDFNASMAPNGFEQVWTGLLLRMENEAQLATVLGHEAAHFVLRHTLERFETTQRTSRLLLAAQMGVGMSGVGLPDTGPVYVDPFDVGRMIALGYLAAYSRSQEAEADRHGFEMMASAGYDPHQAAAVWRNLMAERDACDLPTPPVLFASHPPSKERLQSLSDMADERDGEGETGAARYRRMIAPYRGEWLRMELDQGHFCRAGVLLDRLIEQGYRVGELYYYQGERYRLRGDDGDTAKAIDAYREAMQHDGAPVAVHRDLALALWRDSQLQASREAFQRYIRAADAPDDAAMIRVYLEQLP